MPYTKQSWSSGSAGGTPISATRLNYMETGIENAHIIADSKAAVTTAIPTTLAFGDAAAVGTATTSARADHRHGMPSIVLSSAAPTTQAFGDVPAVGTALEPARGDHRHGMPLLSNALPTVLGTASAGTSADSARGDHVHPTTGLSVLAAAENLYSGVQRWDRAADTEVVRTGVPGDTNSRWYMTSNGRMFWGSGAAVQDVELRRDAAGVLRTPQSLTVDGTLTAPTINSAAALVLQTLGVPRLTLQGAGSGNVNAGNLHTAYGLSLLDSVDGSRNADAPISTYKYGHSAFVVGSAQTGWPENFGIVVTMRYQSDDGRLFQIFYGTLQSVWTRRYNPSNSTWTAWNSLTASSGGIGAYSVNSESTTSTAYTDLTTAGPSVTVEVGGTGKVLLTLSARLQTAATPQVAWASSTLGAAIAAQDSWGIGGAGAGAAQRFSATTLVGGLAPGNHTFTMKYRTTESTGTFAMRRIAVIPLG